MGVPGDKVSICIDCQLAVGGCSWSELDKRGRVRFEPVPGWDAVPVKRKGEFETFQVRACPLFIRDEPRPKFWSDR